MRERVFADPAAKQALEATPASDDPRGVEAAHRRRRGPYVVHVVPLLIESRRLPRAGSTACWWSTAPRRRSSPGCARAAGLPRTRCARIIAHPGRRAQARLAAADDVIDNARLASTHCANRSPPCIKNTYNSRDRDHLRISRSTSASARCCAWRTCSSARAISSRAASRTITTWRCSRCSRSWRSPGRADLKSDLLQELERQKQVLLSFRNNPDIAEDALSSVMRDIEQAARRCSR